MPWKQRYRQTYYYRNRRIRDRVVSEYIGAGPVAELLAEQDAQSIAERAERRVERAALVALARPPIEVTTYAEGVRAIVADVLVALGFHQHKRQWRRKQMTDPDAFSVAMAIYRNPTPSADDIAELRRLINEHTHLAKLGDLARIAERFFLSGYSENPALKAAIDARSALLKQQLSYSESSELERLLIDEVVLCWIDYYRLVAVHARETTEFKMEAMEGWERILSSKQMRYLRAIESLDRMRRRLRLPQVQVNVALDGGQQINVAGQ